MRRLVPPKLVSWIGSDPARATRALRDRVFENVRISPEWGHSMQAAAERGTVVHVLRSGTQLDIWCLEHACERHGLPAIEFVSDQHSAPTSAVSEERSLQAVVARNASAVLFVRHAADRSSQQATPDLVRALVAAQRSATRPILLVPQTLVWGKLPAHASPTLGDALFGPAEQPGILRSLSQLAFNPADARLQAGPAFDLAAFMASHAELSDQAAADKIRYALLRRIERERTIVLGPRKKSAARIRDEILRSPRLRPHLESAARATKKSVEEVRAQASTDLEALIAAPSATLLGFMNRALDRVWNQLYDGLVVDEDGMSRIREASRHGTLILLPSHKSHIDYVVLSDVFYAHGLSPPLVAAGDNLNFWPLGPTLRNAGAFFIHRALSGQKLYSALLAAYIRRLLVEGFTLEVFIEGGRSRSGKLLSPKLGILSMIVDAAIATSGHPIHFVPISIAYERVIEEGAFVEELAGSDKRVEDVIALLKAPAVFASRYGHLYLQVGEIFAFEPMLDAAKRASRAQDGTLSPKARRNLVQAIATRTISEINRVTVVTPAALTATALLCHRKRGVTKAELVEIARELASALSQRGATLAEPLRETHRSQLAIAVSEALDLFADAKHLRQRRTGPQTVYRVPSDHRIALEYYKNGILHFVADGCLLASLLMSRGGAAPTRAELIRAAVELQPRVAFELPTLSNDPAHWDAAITDLIRIGELAEHEGEVRIQDAARARLEMYAWMFRPSLESYRVALRGALTLRGQAVSIRDWERQAIELGERMYIAGEIEVREAISRDRLNNALHALHESGIVRLQMDTQVSAGHQLSSERLQDEEAYIRRVLP